MKKRFLRRSGLRKTIDDATLETAEARYESATAGSVPHPDAGELEIAEAAVKGHGEKTALPDKYQYGDNDLCCVEAQAKSSPGVYSTTVTARPAPN